MEEVQIESEEPLFPEACSEHPAGTGTPETMCPRVVELLRYSVHGKSTESVEQLALPQNPYVYLETMETAEDEEAKPYSIRHTRILCMLGGV